MLRSSGSRPTSIVGVYAVTPAIGDAEPGGAPDAVAGALSLASDHTRHGTPTQRGET